MKTRIVSTAMSFLCLFSGAALADRPMERGEILQIFGQLTSQPRKTWISAGTIQASHEEYKASKITDPNAVEAAIRAKIRENQANIDDSIRDEDMRKMNFDAIPFNVRYELSNEYTMKSSVVVKYDGERFYWEINVDSRTDSVTPGKDFAENYMVNHFDREWNQKRIFAWDGEKYTIYSLPGNNAIVNSTGNTQHVVNGPLTAGIIPWGYGYYTYENLATLDSSAVEKEIDGETQIHLTLNMKDGVSTTFVLAPAKDYTLVSYLAAGRGNSLTYRKYSNFQLVADRWVPMTILLEKYDSGTNRLLARDLWTITGIDASVPGVENFDVNYELDAQVEFASPVTAKPAMYRHSGAINTEALLGERLTYASSQGTQKQNCATAALKHTLAKLGKNVSANELAPLVPNFGESTSLAAMKQFVQNMGLSCRAVKTNIQTLKNLKNCQAILHIPGKGHFVVLEAVDDKYVWTIDLSSDKFYYHTDKDFFGMDWTEGVALLMSNQPINQEGDFVELANDKLMNITGGAGYSCTKLLQDVNTTYCSEPVQGACEGTYKEYFRRWGCQSDVSGSCSSSKMVRYMETNCIMDSYNACIGTDDWVFYYMKACQ
jgi:hypothetical protein